MARGRRSGARSRMRGLWLLLCLLVWLPCSLYSQDVSEMTNEQIISELLTNLREREQILSEKERLLQERDENSAMLASSLQTINESLNERDSLIDARLNSLDAIENSLKSLNADLRRTRWTSSIAVVILAVLAAWGWLN